MSAVCSQDLIGVGWDVRGWQSNQQATAVARFRVGTGSVEWLGVSDHFGFAKGSLPGLKDLIAPALRVADTDVDLSAARLAIAIDAPLSLPKALGNSRSAEDRSCGFGAGSPSTNRDRNRYR